MKDRIGLVACVVGAALGGFLIGGAWWVFARPPRWVATEPRYSDLDTDWYAT